MAITVSGTTVTFNDASTQTTAPVNTSANVNSITAGSGISVSASTGAVTISATGGGTVTSVATGNGLSGGTITSSGTLVIACPTYNTVGSYVTGITRVLASVTITSGANYAAGAGNLQVAAHATLGTLIRVNNLSGTWKYMAGTETNTGCDGYAVANFCRVS